MTGIKEQLYALCEEYIQKRESEIKKIISDARDAANNETKSSAGDKYETGREVMQQEIDLNLTRLNEINKLKMTMERIVPDCKCATAQPGALISTSNGNYYVAISAGQLKIEDTTYYAISAASPIGGEMIGKRSGDSFTLNGKQITIKSIS